MLRGLAAAIDKADRLGKPVQISFTITPESGAPKIALTEIGLSAPDTPNVVFQAARERGARRIADILNGSDMLSADAFAKEIGATRETVNNKRKRHEILGLKGPKRGIRFPRWQLSGSGELLPRLPELFEALGGLPWAVYRFLLTRHAELDGKCGLDALRDGPASDVIDAARSIRSGTFA